MAFRKLSDYNETKYGGLFVLRNDGDYADVIFLYQSEKDVLVADAHYIKSDASSRYVHCCGIGCPACARKIRTQTKLFIPVYNITDQEVQIWDRNISFENQLQRDVFGGYPNPSECVFRIVRHGVAGSIETTYEIRAVAKVPDTLTYEKICADNNIQFPEYYNNVIREVSSVEMDSMLSITHNVESPAALPNYKITPRGVGIANNEAIPTPPAVNIPPQVPVPVSPNNIDTSYESSDNIDAAYDVDLDEDTPF